MKIFKYMYIMLVMLASVLSFTSCSNDDNNNGTITTSTLIGKWYSYKATVYAQNKNTTVSINKTGNYSQMYIEMDFKDDSKVIGYSWEVDKNGISKWVSETGHYTINGSAVNVTFDGETASLMYENNSLCIRIDTKDENNNNITGYVYLKK